MHIYYIQSAIIRMRMVLQHEISLHKICQNYKSIDNYLNVAQHYNLTKPVP